MNEYENRAKRLKLIYEKAKTIEKVEMEKMVVDSDKKSNFSSLSVNSATGAAVVRGNSNAKGDVRKLVIKNFRSEFRFHFHSTLRENAFNAIPLR